MKLENLEQHNQTMAAEIKDLQEKKQKIEISESELNIALEDSKKISLELNEKLSENMANNKKSEEEFNAYKEVKEALIFDLTSQREQLRDNAAQMQVLLLRKNFSCNSENVY